MTGTARWLAVEAVVLRRAGKALVFARTEAVGVWHGIIEDVRQVLRDEGRADLAEGLPNGTPIDSRGPEIVLDSTVGPPYHGNPAGTPRTFI